MMIIVRYEFVIVPDNGSESYVWGYRTDRKRAIKRLREVKHFFRDRAEVEVYMVVSQETRHIVNLEEDNE